MTGYRRAFEHMSLSSDMKEVGTLYDELHKKLVALVPPSAQLNEALEMLWDAKDAAIRAKVDGPGQNR